MNQAASPKDAPTDRGPLEITEHCILRWMERKHGLDLEAIKDAIFEEVCGGLVSGKLMKTNHKKGGVRVLTADMAYIIDPVTLRVITCYEPAEHQL